MMPKPRAYAMTHALGYVLDVITPEEHERSEGKYTLALYDQAAIDAQQAEIERLRTALAKIADWDSNWGPFPENNEAWCAMVVVTAREAVPELGPNAQAEQPARAGD